MKIPRIIHRIWISEERVPTQYLEYGESWRFHHPEWTFIVWTQHNLPPLVNYDEFHDSHNVGQKADILRYEVLHAYGGLYVDMDFECLRPIDSLVDNLECFVGEEEAGSISNALIGSIPGHFLLRKLLHRLPDNIRKNAGKWPVRQTGPRFLTACARAGSGWDPKITVFPPRTFYAFDLPEARGSRRSKQDLSEAYAVHHGDGRWRDQPFDKFVRGKT
jgi:inositol phosphorylceramide mannosyltransferase catalytic subunit